MVSPSPASSEVGLRSTFAGQILRRDIDVDPHAEHDAVSRASAGEDPGQLPPVHEQVVRQLDSRHQPGCDPDTVCRREAGDAGQSGKALRLDGRAQVHREEQARAGRGEPRAAEATPPRGLGFVGNDDCPFRRIGRQLALGRLAPVEIAVRMPKAPLEERLHVLREQRVLSRPLTTRLISHVASLEKEEIEAILPH